MEAEVAGSGELKGTTTAHDVLEERRTEMEEIAAKMLFLKKEGRPKSDLRELNTNASLLFISLRQVNRSILLEEDRVKAETESAKAPVDFTTLQLHNLMYEKNHYMKAIKVCKDFKSKYPDVDLVPEAEFFNSAPDDIKGGVLANDAAHDLMLKRLHFELFQLTLRGESSIDKRCIYHQLSVTFYSKDCGITVLDKDNGESPIERVLNVISFTLLTRE